MINFYPLIRPFLFRLDAEKAHNLSLWALRSALVPATAGHNSSVTETKIWGLTFPNPVGLAAGYDKNGAVLDALLGLGFGFVEAGSVTPMAQPGNPKPRIFRLVEDEGIINRLGFNNQGLAAAVENFKAPRRAGIVGANLGANKDSADRNADYVAGLKALGPLADYVTVNISSPNTPGLRALQGRQELDELLSQLLAAREALSLKRPLLLKIAPDLLPEDMDDIATVILARNIDGLIVSNTTITRPEDLKSRHRNETGGLSGAPLKDLALTALREMAGRLKGRIPLVAVGGISSGADAYQRILNGASLVQIYSAMIYEGPYLADRINRDLADLLRRDGYSHISEAVGAALR